MSKQLLKARVQIMAYVLLFLSLFTSNNNIMAQDNKGLPPLIDREVFFGDPEIAGAQLSPDGKMMSFIKPYNDVRNIWVKPVDAPFESAKPITADERPIPGYFWSRDGKYILYVQDKGGNENFHVYAVDPGGKPGAGNVPEGRNLTPIDGARAMIYSVPKEHPDIMYVGLNDRDPAWHDLYQVEISTGTRRLMFQNLTKITGYNFDNNGELRLASKTTDEGDTEIYRVTEGGLVKCYSCNSEETCYVIRFHKDNRLVYMVTNKGDIDLTELVLLDPVRGTIEKVESDPQNQVDFGGASFSQVTNDLVATSYIGDKPRIYFKNERMAMHYEYIKSKMPGSEINFNSSSKDEKMFLVSATSDTDPGAVYLYKIDIKELKFQYRPRPDLPTKDLAKMEAVHYKSSDGLEIPAYLTLPRGVEAKNLPVIMFIHGGPWARDYWGYHPYAQFFANRGYAVLQPNFRASTGYGKAFLNAGNLEWGELMQDDITWGVKYLVDRGIADPKRVGIMGGSYGGYATLAGVTFTPDLYAAGVSIVGPSNLLTLLESIPAYWESFRVIFHKRMGNPETEEGEKKLMEQSPLFSADKIRTPLMVVQGANDPRVKQAESDQIVFAMHELGLPVEYIVAPDEGHGFRAPDNQMAFIAASEKFLANHLGGRYQADMPKEIKQKLEEITVDVSTVKMPETMDDQVMTKPLPKPVHQLTPGDYGYTMTIRMGGQEIPMQIKRTLEEIDGKWKLSDVATSQMGNMTDQITMDKTTLCPLSRSITQGPMKMKIDVTEAAVSGNINMNGKDTQLNIPLEGPVLCDGGGMDITLAALPLEVGYSTIYRSVDIQTQKVNVFEVKVLDKETIKVPAGSFEVYKIEVKPLDGSPGMKTCWITSSGQRILVKKQESMPAMGGATVTLELENI